MTAAVSPESIAVDLNNLSALGKNVAVTVPNGLKIEKIESNGAVPAAGTDYTQTSTGAAISAGLAGQAAARKLQADADALGRQNGGNRHCGYRFFGERKCAECVF